MGRYADDETYSSAVIRTCGNPDANLNVLLVNSDRKPQGNRRLCCVEDLVEMGLG